MQGPIVALRPEDGAINCPSCGSSSRHGANFCRQCRAALRLVDFGTLKSAWDYCRPPEGPRDQFYQHKAVIKHPQKKVKPRQKRPLAEVGCEALVEASPCGTASPPLNQDTPPISDSGASVCASSSPAVPDAPLVLRYRGHTFQTRCVIQPDIEQAPLASLLSPQSQAKAQALADTQNGTGARPVAAPVVWKGGVRVGFGPFHRRRRQQWSLLLTATLTTPQHHTGEGGGVVLVLSSWSLRVALGGPLLMPPLTIDTHMMHTIAGIQAQPPVVSKAGRRPQGEQPPLTVLESVEREGGLQGWIKAKLLPRLYIKARHTHDSGLGAPPTPVLALRGLTPLDPQHEGLGLSQWGAEEERRWACRVKAAATVTSVFQQALEPITSRRPSGSQDLTEPRRNTHATE